jgi:multicomponent Na+:H+ antiporter subunit B
MPRFGEPKNPTNLHVVNRYLEKGEEEAGCKNVVTDIILNYRGYDTMGEVTVIFTALCAALAILKRENFYTSFSLLDTSPNKTSIVVRVIVSLMFPLILLFGMYVILHGEDSPGGGFQGGTVIAASLILFTLVFGFRYTLNKLSPKLREFFENAAPLTFFLVGILGIMVGIEFLSFMLPIFSKSYQPQIARLLLSLIEIGIGIGGGAIFTSLFFSMQREEK